MLSNSHLIFAAKAMSGVACLQKVCFVSQPQQGGPAIALL